MFDATLLFIEYFPTYGGREPLITLEADLRWVDRNSEEEGEGSKNDAKDEENFDVWYIGR